MTQVDPLDPPEPVGIDPAVHAEVALENALLRAGVDLESEQGKLVKAAWTGHTPDLEAIKTQWQLVKPAPPATEPIPDPEPARIAGEASQAAERRDLSANSVVEPSPEDVDPRDASVQAGLDVMSPPPGRRAGTRDNAQAAVVHTLLEAAASGDGRVLVDEPASASQ